MEHNCKELIELIKKCWDNDYTLRPTFGEISSQLVDIKTNYETHPTLTTSVPPPSPAPEHVVATPVVSPPPTSDTAEPAKKRIITIRRFHKKKIPHKVEVPETLEELITTAKTLFKDPEITNIWKFDEKTEEFPVNITLASALEDGGTYQCVSDKDVDDFENS